MISIPTYRACVLCQHGRAPEGTCPVTGATGEQRRCVCPAVTGRRDADWPMGVPVAIARAQSGPCGIEARHLSFPGLHP